MDITSANAIIMLSSPLVFPVPYQLQEFATDNIYGTNPVDAGEIRMGVDGRLTAGFVNVPTEQNYSLMADSLSNFFFDQIYAKEKANQTKYVINGVLILPAVSTKWTMTRGFLKTYQPMPDAGKVLNERKHSIVWQTALPSPA